MPKIFLDDYEKPPRAENVRVETSLNRLRGQSPVVGQGPEPEPKSPTLGFSEILRTLVRHLSQARLWIASGWPTIHPKSLALVVHQWVSDSTAIVASRRPGLGRAVPRPATH